MDNINSRNSAGDDRMFRNTANTSSDGSNQVHQQENVQVPPEADPLPEEVPVVVRTSRSTAERFCAIS